MSFLDWLADSLTASLRAHLDARFDQLEKTIMATTQDVLDHIQQAQSQIDQAAQAEAQQVAQGFADLKKQIEDLKNVPPTDLQPILDAVDALGAAAVGQIAGVDPDDVAPPTP